MDTPPAAGRDALLEREHELAAIDRLLTRLHEGAGGLLLVEGPAGVGKTRLVEAAAERAALLGYEVARARGGDLETELPFGVVRQLFEPLLAGLLWEDRAQLFQGAAVHAAPIVDPRHLRPATPSPDPSPAALHGLYWLCSNLAERRPLLLAVDDVQWADPASLRFVAYLARRVGGIRAAVVLAQRPADPGPTRDVLGVGRDASLAEVARPGPLSLDAAAEVSRTAFAQEPSKEFVHACHAASGGNPFYLRETLAAAAANDLRPIGANAVRMADLGVASVGREVNARVGRLGPHAGALVRAVATLGASAQLGQAARVAGLEHEEAAAAADALGAAAVLRPERPLRFCYPVIRAAIYQGLPAGERCAAHARAARVLAREGAGADQIAMHLLHTDGREDPWVVGALRRAAREAVAAGAPEAAVSCLRRALSEPPAIEVRGSILLELGSAEFAVREPATIDHLRQALAAVDDPREGGRAAMALGRALLCAHRTAEGVDLMEATIEQLESVDRELALQAEGDLLALALYAPSTHGLIPARLERYGNGDRLEGRTAGERAVLVQAAVRSAQSGDSAARTARLAWRGWADGALLNDEGAYITHVVPALRAMAVAGRCTAAEQLATQALGHARRQGSVSGSAAASTWRCEARFRTGDVDGAHADFVVAHEAMGDEPDDFLPLAALQFSTWALLERGEADHAARLFEARGLGGALPESHLFAGIVLARGHVRLAQGNLRAGLEDLLEGGRREEAWGEANPACLPRPWRSSAALAHSRLGEDAQARRLVAEELALARSYGAAWAIGVCLRAAGLLEEGQRGIDLLHEAIDVLTDSGAVLEHARALTDLGAALRRAGDPRGRAHLREALDLADRCGATVLADRARRELLAAGARPRRKRISGREALTPSEGRVAQMAAQGLSNRDIAQSLFVTTKTVESHLRRAYGKLGVRSRDELAATLEAW